MSDYPFLKSLNLPDKIFANQDTQFDVEAEWPNPSWEMESIQIDPDPDSRILKISCNGRRKPGVSIMVIKPFRFQFSFSFPSAGTWQLEIFGKSKNITKNIIVQ